MEKTSGFWLAFEKFGKTKNVFEILLRDLKKFVSYMYGKPNYTDVYQLRYELSSQKYQGRLGELLGSYDGVDLSLLPICI